METRYRTPLDTGRCLKYIDVTGCSRCTEHYILDMLIMIWLRMLIMKSQDYPMRPIHNYRVRFTHALIPLMVSLHRVVVGRRTFLHLLHDVAQLASTATFQL